MKKILLSGAFIGLAFSAFSQKMMTKEAYIRFFGSTPLENIEAATNQGSSVIDVATGDVVIQALLNSFNFEKALMQEHFNENYVESAKYPKVVFKGKIPADIDLKTPGTYKTNVTGTMSLHGVDRQISVPCVIVVEKEQIKVTANFAMVPEDYKIEIPGAVRNKIAEKMDVTMKAVFKPITK